MDKYLYLFVFNILFILLDVKKRKAQAALLFPAMSPSTFDVKQTRNGSGSP